MKNPAGSSTAAGQSPPNLLFGLVSSLLLLTSAGLLSADQGGGPTALPDKAAAGRLYLHYLPGGKGFNSTTVHAAMQMLADNGDWKVVLEELESGGCGSEMHCVQVLGMMAEKEAQRRRSVELHYRGEYRGQMMMGSRRPYVPTELIPALLRRATDRKAGHWKHYVTALAQSRDERAKDFFFAILNDKSKDWTVEAAAFHAAVGLANLHEAAGIEWLIEHSDEDNKSVKDGWPKCTPGQRMDVACDRALTYLSGRYSNGECTCSRGVEYWRKWWQDAINQVPEDTHIPLVYWQQ